VADFGAWSLIDHVPGVTKTISGYTGGHTKNPTYKDVTHSNTGHREAVKIHVDPAKVTYEQLLKVFWRSLVPLTRVANFATAGKAIKRQSLRTPKSNLNWRLPPKRTWKKPQP
jgi:methionine-S-sulfoxide reductase